MPTDAGRRLSEAHRQAQVRLGAQTVARLIRVWPLLDLNDLDGTAEAWLTAAGAVTEAQRQASIGLAAAYARALRTVETGSTEGFTIPPSQPVDPDALRTSLLVTGPLSVKRAMTRGVSLAAASETAMAASSAAGMRHSLNGGRELIRGAVRADPKAKGYQRATSGNACAYCAGKAGVRFSSDEIFHAHDGCACMAVPAY